MNVLISNIFQKQYHKKRKLKLISCVIELKTSNCTHTVNKKGTERTGSFGAQRNLAINPHSYQEVFQTENITLCLLCMSYTANTLRVTSNIELNSKKYISAPEHILKDGIRRSESSPSCKLHCWHTDLFKTPLVDSSV